MPKVKILSADFFNRPTLSVARDLLGSYLVRRLDGRTQKHLITEVEVYDGFRDKGSHASHGRTRRNEIMFGPAGHWYVYFTYGMHWMLNIVTREPGYPAAILIRGLADTPGPARLTKKLSITGKLNGQPAAAKSGLWLEAGDLSASSYRIKKGPRIGINYAGPFWASRHWRFFLEHRKNQTRKIT